MINLPFLKKNWKNNEGRLIKSKALAVLVCSGVNREVRHALEVGGVRLAC